MDQRTALGGEQALLKEATSDIGYLDMARMQDDDDYWGRRDLWDTCCTDKLACSQVLR